MNADNTVETIEVAGQSVPTHYGDPAAEYAAARAGAVIIPRPHVGRLRATDRDRLDLLHRLSTNDLTGMAVGEARPTVLTNAHARMVDLLWVLNRDTDALYITGVGRAAAVRRWLAGYVFYNDRVKFEDLTQTWGHFELFGPRASVLAETLQPGAAALPENHFMDSDGLLVWRTQLGFALLAPAAQRPAVWERVVTAGATPAGESTFQLLRLTAGIPEADHEITDGYIPLEANLWPAVSFNKGCYLGQEIIARMESRGKLARRLCGLRLAAPVSVGAQVRVNGTASGTITSAGVVPEIGPLALAYLKTAVAEPGQAVWVADTPGQVADLPFI
jgi:folate-binding protein YgfZ